MTITFKCEHCGKKIEAPDYTGGKRGKCPYCKQSNYIPTPVADDDLVPLAPEDTETEQQSQDERSQERVLIDAPVADDDLIPLAPEDTEAEQQSQDERSQERVLTAAMDTGEATSVPLEHRDEVSAEDLYHLVVNYCMSLSNSKLEQAEDHLARLQRFPHSATTAVRDFISGKAIEPALDEIPAKLLQGFLNQLRDALKV